MTTNIVARSAQARCYECGAPAVVAVCHHCGRGICTAHLVGLGRLARWLWRAEYADLELAPGADQAPAHCMDCAHTTRVPRESLVAVGVAAAAIGALRLPPRFALADMLLVAIGLAFAAAVFLLNRPWWLARLRARPPLPVLPRLSSLNVSETVAASVALDAAGQYRVDLQPTRGTIELVASLPQSERERLALYRKQYRLQKDQPARFHAGFAVLRDSAAMRLGAATPDMTASNIFELAGPVSAQPALSGGAGRETDRLTRSYDYQVPQPPKPMGLPVSLVPALTPDADQRALSLELQWSKPEQWGGPLELDRVELLRVEVPVGWGGVAGASPGARIGAALDGAGRAVQQIEWRRLPHPAGGPASFALAFDAQIDRCDTIRGRVEVRFRGALSAIKGIDLYSPLGHPRPAPAAQIYTTVAVDFELSLAGVRYQSVRQVPDLQHPNDQHKPAEVEYPGVVPDQVTVNALVDALACGGYYVKRKIESPPRVGERVNVRNRYWDIAGRRYAGVYPIDFHLVLSGKELLAGGARAQAGTTQVCLTVRGAYVSPEMAEQVEQLWGDLHELIKNTMDAQLRGEAAGEEDAGAEWAGDGAALVDSARARLSALMSSLYAGQLSEVRIYEELRGLAQDLDLLAEEAAPLYESEVGGQR